MKFRCYACGFEFSKGLPPMEALSLDQLAAVTDDGRPEIHHDLLFGTKFEGMSTYNFCAFCLTAIRDYPLAMENKSDTPGHKMVWCNTKDIMPIAQEGPHHYLQCGCGYTFFPDVKSGHSMSSVIINREMVMHLIKDVFYADTVSEEIRSLINKEM